MTDQAPTTFERVLSVPKDGGMDETARRNRQLLADAYYQATVEGRNLGMMNLLSPDITFHEAASLPYGCDNMGIDGAKAGVAAMFAAWSHVRSEFLEYTAAGDLVICYLRFTGTARATGEIYDAYGTEVFRFRDGKIIEWRPFYWDTHAVRKVCGVE